MVCTRQNNYALIGHLLAGINVVVDLNKALSVE